MSVIALPFESVGSRYVRNLELIKWTGLVAMLFDHAHWYVLGYGTILSESVGALALPLFAVALSAGLSDASRTKLVRIGWKLAGWGILAGLSTLLVRDALPVNILFTLALGVACHAMWNGSTWLQASSIIPLLILGAWVEFSIPGVLLVWWLLDAMRSDRPALLLIPLVLSASLFVFNGGSHAALLAGLVVVGLSLLPKDLDRVPGLFYWLYVAQFPVFWVAAKIWG